MNMTLKYISIIKTQFLDDRYFFLDYTNGMEFIVSLELTLLGGGMGE